MIDKLKRILDTMLAYQHSAEGEYGMGRSNEELEAEGATDPSITELRELIKELESQEPFGYVNRDELVKHMGLVGCGTIYKDPAEGRLALYTHPPQPAQHGITKGGAA